MAGRSGKKREHGKPPAAEAGRPEGAPEEAGSRLDEGAARLPDEEPLPLAGEPEPPPRRKRRRRPVPRSIRYPLLTVEQILEWADAHLARTGEWPTQDSGQIADAPREKWKGIDAALRCGYRGLPGGTTLPRLLAARRGRRHLFGQPSLTEEQILMWADLHFTTHGEWPTQQSGDVLGAPGEDWRRIDGCLREGGRGLSAGSSLPRLLAARRGRRNVGGMPRLTVEEILEWAAAHFARAGQWPTRHSGRVCVAQREIWRMIDTALATGQRGLPGGTTLAQLLAGRRGMRHPSDFTPLAEGQILEWADLHFTTHGEWPTQQSGDVLGAPGEDWRRIDGCLRKGGRGVSAGSSLARLLAARRGRRNKQALPRLCVATILAWADAHVERTGEWPRRNSGPIPEAPGENWHAVDVALLHGLRGLPGRATLAGILREERGVRHKNYLPPFSVERILQWADDHHARTGNWPRADSGGVLAAPGEIWTAVQAALIHGRRGLPGGSSLAQLLNLYRQIRNPGRLPRLSEEEILAVADAHHERTGRWPTHLSGAIPEMPGETWLNVDSALRAGRRGLERSSLFQLLKKHGRKTRRLRNRELSEEQIVSWAQAHFERHGRWPGSGSGAVEDAPGESWGSIHVCLVRGHRGLPAGTTLVRLLKAHGLRE